MIEKFLKVWKSLEGHTLSREDLDEGKIYSCTLTNGGEVFINECTFSVINGSLHIFSEANWKTPQANGGVLNKKNYDFSSIPCGSDVPCFKYLGKLEDNGGFTNNQKETKNLIISKSSPNEYSVVNKKTREKWFVDREGAGSTPDKHIDKPLERELLKALGVAP